MKPRSTQTKALTNSTPPSPKYARALRSATRTALRIAAWNAAFIISALLLIALAGEAYFRLTKPFIENDFPSQFVDGVGLMREPNAELRYANWNDDLWLISRANSQGFLDREPVDADRASAGCHIAFIGDSFVAAKEVPIADKFHVRLEEMAARELPHLDITAQAYGIRATGQINQIPFYDEYARRLNPKLVALVFFANDFVNNSAALHSLKFGMDPDRLPYMSAHRNASGNIELRPPDPEYERFLLARLPKPLVWQAWDALVGVSYFAKWLTTKSLWSYDFEPQHRAWADTIAERPCCASFPDGWQPGNSPFLFRPFTKERLPPTFQEALAYTAFGIDQFKRRADRDGARLLILAATEDMGTPGDPQFDRLSAIAEARGIPVISDYDYIVRQAHNPRNGRWRSNGHWNPAGHQWAAEAVLEWLKANQDVCD